MDNNLYARAEANRNWDRARRDAVISDILSVFSNRRNYLLSFDEVQTRLRLTHKNYRGLQDVPVERILGSVGRYRDFTRTFLPRHDDLRERWERVNASAFSRGMRPIEVYQVGEAYFVLDGNHRVSIARQTGMSTISAHVWEFETPVGLSAEADLDEVIIKAEYADFLRRTGLDVLRPEADIVFSTPGRYLELEYQIALYQLVLEKIDDEPVSYEDAVTAWYDMIYEPAIQIIRERGIMERFEGRTEADLFAWVWRHHQELEGQGIHRLADAVDSVGTQVHRPLPARLWGWLKSLFVPTEG